MRLQKLVDEIRNIPDEVDTNITVYENVVWMEDGDTLYINTDQNTNHLHNHGGDTYTWEVKGYYESEDGWALFPNADSGCGYTDTIVVNMYDQDLG